MPNSIQQVLLTVSNSFSVLFAINYSSFDPFPGDGGGSVTQSANTQNLEHASVEGDCNITPGAFNFKGCVLCAISAVFFSLP